jgi:Phorbol esters/diacylglycerol binding domain (C1 domain)
MLFAASFDAADHSAGVRVHVRSRGLQTRRYCTHANRTVTLAYEHCRFIAGRHAWVAGSAEIANTDMLSAGAPDHRFCAFCGASADSDDAIQCGICLQHAHYNCMAKRHNKHGLKCKAVFRSQLDCDHSTDTTTSSTSTSSSTAEPGSSPLAKAPPHQWQLTSVLPGRPCACCAKPFDADRAGLDGFRCTWCSAEVHRGCVSKAKKSICTLGRHRKLSLPPAAIVQVTRTVTARPGTSKLAARLQNAAKRAIPLGRKGKKDSAHSSSNGDSTAGAELAEIADAAAAAAAETDKDNGKDEGDAPESEDSGDSLPAPTATADTEWTAAVEEVPDDGVPTLVYEGGRKRSSGRRAARAVTAYNVTLSIAPEAVPVDVTPLAVLVNTKSGAGKKQGLELLGILRGLLNPFQANKTFHSLFSFCVCVCGSYKWLWFTGTV